MDVCFWHLVIVRAYTEQVTFYKVSEKHGHVYRVRLYLDVINEFEGSIAAQFP